MSFDFARTMFLKTYECSVTRLARSMWNRITCKLATALVALAGLAAVLLFVYQNRGGDTIDYHGERIKLTRKYADFSTYKNDPNNIEVTETARVQRLVRQVPIASSFGSRIEFAQATGSIAFPGYGSGALLDTPQPDGSVLVLTRIEIPRAEEDRYFTARVSNGKYILIDDFVAPESARLQFVEQVGDKLIYTSDFHGEKKLIRPIR